MNTTTITTTTAPDGRTKYTLATDACPDAGYLYLAQLPNGRAYVDTIATRVAYRRQGIASRLLDAAAADLGYTPEPETILQNRTAPAFWQRHGFTEGFNQNALD